MIKKLKAFGLVEALLALAIFGTAIISATAVTISSLRIVKNNELADFANSIMIRSMEYTRSESGTPRIDSATGSFPLKFKVTGDVTTTNIGLEETIGADILEISNCDTSSVFLVDMTSNPNLNGLLFCNQIIVNPIGTGGNYKITSRMVYQVGDEFRFSEISGFKVK